MDERTLADLERRTRKLRAVLGKLQGFGHVLPEQDASVAELELLLRTVRDEVGLQRRPKPAGP